MGSPRAWLLNFEADFELAQVGGYSPDRPLRERLEELRRKHGAGVLREGDLLLDAEGPLDPRLRGLEGRAWCPTPTALSKLARLGLIVPDAPSLEVLRQANDRAFSAQLGQALPGAFFTRDAAELERRLAEASVSGAWVCKRAFGVSGRGQLRLRRPELGESQRAWLAASLRRGGLQVEPLVPIELEFVTHGLLHPDGRFEVRPSCVMVCDSQGAWVETRPAREGELEAAEGAALVAEARRAASALAELGYFGPFGVDAFRWRDRSGGRHLQPRSEVNGRYTMGWRVSFPEH